MKNSFYRKFQALKKNKKNKVVYFKNGLRKEKLFKDLHKDVEHRIKSLNEITKDLVKKKDLIGILGPTSYEWLISDFACIVGGYKSAALPEFLSLKELNKIISDLNITVLLVDYSFKTKVKGIKCENVYYINCSDKKESLNVENVDTRNVTISTKNIIREDYSIVFSSGTSQKIKYINRYFWELGKESFTDKIKKYWSLRGSIWLIITRLKYKKIIIFLPFSHPMQRWFAQIALNNGIDIVLSDEKNCIKHIIFEKPNIMISVPPIYDALGSLIEARIKRFTNFKKKAFVTYNYFRINRLGRNNLLKKVFDHFLFSDIKNVIGGRADLFITGSAATKKSTLETFYKIGIKIYEAYSQSELSTIIINSPKNFKLGSVGKPKKELKVKITEEGEILLKFNKEYDDSNSHILNVKDGYIHTGDIGFLDKKGFLFVTGRLDDVIVLDRGKKVHPKLIEEQLAKEFGNDVNIVFSSDRDTVSVIIFANALISEVDLKLKKINKILPTYEKIKSYRIVNELPSIENKMLTTTMKVKRKYIIERYNKELQTIS